ncbi:valine--tRNA ligase [Candidatus Babeliales bacterium]|nr:valine--tRNA ligase [Candidatus Babeliales bacterium]
MDKRYDHLTCEKEARALWEQENIYAFNPDVNAPVYSIDTPPPTVSGTLHIGHVFSYTHADLVARYKRMQGYNVFYPMGFDDNGLPTERFVEKKNKTKAHLMKRSEFIALCLKETADVEKLFEGLWRAMGLSVDWTKVYSTISDDVRKVSQYSFIDLYNKNLVYRRQEPSLYCTTCQTSVAQAEIDNAEVSTTFNDIAFEAEDGQVLTIATTRPELLPACVAVFYHPADVRYQKLAGTHAITPIFGKRVPIIADDQVDPEKGSGLVMCCTFGDQMDIAWFKKHSLPIIETIGRDGKWAALSGELAGLRVHEARKKVLELLEQAGKLITKKAITHNVNMHERCKQEIEYQILEQWFVKILENKDKFIELADKINWRPAYMKARYKDWVQNLNWDWCISRQRFFGIPFPLWHCLDCKQVLVADLKDLPIDPQEQAFPGGACTQCGSQAITPETDVMDTWNTSSLTPQVNALWPDGKAPFALPMSMRPQAHDIIRTWAFYTIIKSYYHHNDIPWNDIMISGHVLAGKGEKISKSKENEKMTPEGLLKDYPADVIRFWAASGKLGTDTAFSDNQLKIGHKLVTKLWNAFRFCKDFLADYRTPATKPQLNELNEWLFDGLGKAMDQYKRAFEEYEYSQALDAVERFFWHDFCDNYLELIKDQLFNPANYDQEVIQGTQRTLYEVGFGILQLYAPFVPHITESIYQLMFKEQEQVVSLQITKLDYARFAGSYSVSAQVIEHVLSIVAQVRRLKSEQQVSLKTSLQGLTICSKDQDLLNSLHKQATLLKGITKAEEISFVVQEGTTSIVQEGEVLTATVLLVADQKDAHDNDN